MMIQKSERRSGIELLKIFAIFLIIVNHVVQTLCEPNEYIPYQDYLLNIENPTGSAVIVVLAILRYSGSLGNTLFFVCSAWFLLDKEVSNKRKLYFMAADLWVFSILFLLVTLIMSGGRIAPQLIVKSVFPVIFSSNWYVTCYILFSLICPFLNWIITKMTQVQLLESSIFGGVLYLLMNWIKTDLFFSSSLILWVTLYFIMAYAKNYMSNFFANIRINIILILIGLFGNCGVILLTNFIGYHGLKLTYWNNLCNPLLVMAAMGLVHIAYRAEFKNKFINYISSASLLIYIIHENILVRTYCRPAIWQYIYEKCNYKHILLWVFVYSLGIFVVSFLISIGYKTFLQKAVHSITNKIMSLISRIYKQLEIKILKIN